MYALTITATVGAFQGAVILLSMLFRFRHRKNLPLALLLLVFSVRLATIPTWNPDMLLPYPWVYPATAPLPFLFGPFLWWHVRELASETLNTPKYVYLHFLPYILEVIAVSYTLLSMSAGEYELFLQNVFSGHPPLWLPVRNAFKVLVNVIYLILSARIAFGKSTNRLSVPKRFCLRAMVVVPSIVLIAFSYVAVIPSATERLLQGTIMPFFILSLTMVVLIYGISLFLLIAPEVSPSGGKLATGPSEQLCSEQECEQLVELMEKRFAQGAYLNPDLMLSDFAAEFSVHANRLSYAVNRKYKVSFRTLLNTRRLDYFFGRIKQGAHRKQSILELAFEAGFPSKSTFNRVFKETMGMSPSEYVKQSG